MTHSPGDRLSIRRAQPSDLEHLLHLMVEIMEHHRWPLPAEHRLRAILTDALASDNHLFLLAEVSGVPVGMCALLFTVSTWSAAEAAEVQDMLVTQTYRRRGAGRTLLRAAMEEARKRGCFRVHLDAETWNVEAHRFYREMGFLEKPSRRFEINVGLEDQS